MESKNKFVESAKEELEAADLVKTAQEEDNETTTSQTDKMDTAAVKNPEQAMVQVAGDVDNTIYDAKRMLGLKFGDEKIQENSKIWPF